MIELLMLEMYDQILRELLEIIQRQLVTITMYDQTQQEIIHDL